MKVFVYYNDDYPDNGGVGLEECSSRQEAEEFILKRIKQEPLARNLSMYKVIEGNMLEPTIAQVIDKISLR